MAKSSNITYIGRVIDHEKQAPISRAKVILNYADNTFITYTDLEGIYKFIIPSNTKNTIGEIKIEAPSYKTFYAKVQLSPHSKDFGDMRLGAPNSSNSYSGNNFQDSNNYSSYRRGNQEQIPLPMILAIMMLIFVIFALIIKPSPQNTPVYRRNNTSTIFLPILSKYSLLS
ncbi:hypothetical protein [Calothrix sp. 336/3]|uniref:hypothetical protein n=1 Tax=Calothrix sp. 336/3 TaxID=1337936 RepID=UPI000624E669|nr:hypothetical protein [Calothrix sp. 336/3]AKG23071.1 hypothetical protein IJ00_18965 [Calothrix sp. 336/3]